MKRNCVYCGCELPRDYECVVDGDEAARIVQLVNGACSECREEALRIKAIFDWLARHSRLIFPS